MGIEIGVGRGRASMAEEPKELYRGNPNETYISKEKRGVIGTTGGVGAIGTNIPLFGFLKGKEYKREVEVHFVLPKGREQIEEWKIVLSIVNPATKEEMFTFYNLSETNGKVRTLE
jgi:hypothetical protein